MTINAKQTIAPGPSSWSHKDFVRDILHRTLPYARRAGLVDPKNVDQLRRFAHAFMEAGAKFPTDEENSWDPRFSRQVREDAMIDVVREVLWASCGFPHVVFEDPKLIATYAFTRAPASSVGQLSLPWPAFTIDFRPGDLPIHSSYVHRISVMDPRPPLTKHTMVQVHHAFGLDQSQYYPSLTVEAGLDATYPAYAPEEYQGTPESARLAATVRRLVANVVLALTNQANYEHRSRTLGPKGSYERRMSKLPQTEQYILGRGIKVTVDLRPEMRAYVEQGYGEKTRGPLTVQTLVAGHGKWQVCGPGRAGRKWIFVQPYWRGPEDAPIVVRPHKLGEPQPT